MMTIMLIFILILLVLHNIFQYIQLLILLYYMTENEIAPCEADLQHCKKEVVRHLIKDLI